MAPVDSRTPRHVVRSLEVLLVLAVLGVLRVVFTWAGFRHVVLGEGASDGDVDRQSLAVLPVGDGHVAGASPRLRSQDALLLHLRVEKALAGQVVHEVSHAVVAADEVSRPCAASGVVACNINFLLHAHRTVDFLVDEKDSEAVLHHRAK